MLELPIMGDPAHIKEEFFDETIFYGSGTCARCSDGQRTEPGQRTGKPERHLRRPGGPVEPEAVRERQPR